MILARRKIKFIDREEELNILRKAVDRAIRGEGGVIFLKGEAGIGKTRLARELATYARLCGMQVLSGRCPALFAMDGTPPYIIWKEVIKNYSEISSPEQLFRLMEFYPSEVLKLVPELKLKLGYIPESLTISREHERERLFEAVSQFVANISKEAPFLILIDDLQWTDQSSLLLLHYLARGVFKESLLILGAYREAEIDEKHPLSGVLTEFIRERLLHSISLKRLSSDDVSEMIRWILEQDNIPSDFCEMVYIKTRGNPFFVEEIIKSLKEEDIIYREGDRWNFREVSRIEFPDTVKTVIRNRISRLDDECQHLLMMASFIGQDFTFEVLCEFVGYDEDKLLELLERILTTGLVKERVIRGEDVYSFTDIIVRDVFHEEVSRLRYKKLHGDVGRALEKVYAETIDEHLGELALHFFASGDKEKALNYYLKAGEKSAKVYANSEAVSYFQSALRILEEKEVESLERGCIVEELGDIKRIVGDLDACLKYWSDALLLWKKLEERGKVSRLHRKMANVHWSLMGDMKKARGHHEKALEILETDAESVELAMLYDDIARMYFNSGDLDKALPLTKKALKLGEKLDVPEIIAKSLLNLGFYEWHIGDIKKSIEYKEKALEIALDNEYVETALRAYFSIGRSFEIEEPERCLEYYEKGLALAKKVGHISMISSYDIQLAGFYYSIGNMDNAVSLEEESVLLCRKAGNKPLLSFALAWLGFYYQILGEWDKSEQYCNEALSPSQRPEEFLFFSSIYFCLGYLYFDKGEYGKAREFFDKFLKALEKSGSKIMWKYMSWGAIWTYIELGEIEKSTILIDKLHELALERDDKEPFAIADALRGMIFRTQKKWNKSIEHFEKSLNLYEALSAKFYGDYMFAKLVLCEYARVYLERDQEGDRKKAQNLLNQALEIFQKFGAKKEIEKIIAKKNLLTT